MDAAASAAASRTHSCTVHRPKRIRCRPKCPEAPSGSGGGVYAAPCRAQRAGWNARAPERVGSQRSKRAGKARAAEGSAARRADYSARTAMRGWHSPGGAPRRRAKAGLAAASRTLFNPMRSGLVWPGMQRGSNSRCETGGSPKFAAGALSCHCAVQRRRRAGPRAGTQQDRQAPAGARRAAKRARARAWLAAGASWAAATDWTPKFHSRTCAFAPAALRYNPA